MDSLEIFTADVMVIGGGGAGLRAAIAAREAGAEVLLVSKSRAGFGNNTYISKATFAAPLAGGDPRDCVKVHLEDTLRAGRGFNDKQLASLVAERATEQVGFLEGCGVRFMKEDGSLRFFHLPGHTYPRHVRGVTHTGSDFTLPLLKAAGRIGVRILDHVFITRLFKNEGRFAGACGVTSDGRLIAISSKCAVLATGGFAQIYRNTNNAAGISGDGHAFAYDLGVPLVDMEFVQFYPTALGRFGSRILLYEALIGSEGAVLRNSRGEDIAALYGMDSPAEMTRDRLARAVMQEVLRDNGVEGGVFFDLSDVPEKMMPRLQGSLPDGDFSEGRGLLVRPTAHFCMGGVRIQTSGETQCPGLFAAGEVCAGVHGANRLGGNALAEVFVMGELAGGNAADKAASIEANDLPQSRLKEEMDRLSEFRSWPDIREARDMLKDAMWNLGGIVRNADGIKKALSILERISRAGNDGVWAAPHNIFKTLELHNMLLVSQMVLKSALARQESRGAHYREDFPEEDNEKWIGHMAISKAEGEMQLSFEPL